MIFIPIKTGCGRGYYWFLLERGRDRVCNVCRKKVEFSWREEYMYPILYLLDVARSSPVAKTTFIGRMVKIMCLVR